MTQSLWRSVREQYTPYVFPQEYGNHTGTKWASFTDERGVGLLVVGTPEFDFSAHHFTMRQLTERGTRVN